MKQDNVNLTYTNFKRFEHEIFFDTYDFIIHSDAQICKKTLAKLGSNELHHLVKYHHKTILNALFFQDSNIFIRYHKWLYRVYFYREIDLDFFYFLNNLYKSIYVNYIEHKHTKELHHLFNEMLIHHDTFKENAPKNLHLPSTHKDTENLVEILISGNKNDLYSLCQEHTHTLSDFLTFYNDCISEAMQNIGYLWEMAKVSVAQEHLATSVLNEVLFQILSKFPPQETKQKHILLSSAPEELHGTGNNIASIIFQKLGYEVSNIGTNIPAKEVLKAIAEFQPDCIILSATLPSSLIDLAYLIDDIQQQKSLLNKTLKIGIAGGALESIHNPRKTLHADFYTNKLQDIDNYF